MIRGRLAHGMKRVEVQVEFEDIDAGLAEETKLPPFGVLGDECAHLLFADATLLRYARDLKCRGRGRNVRVEP